MNNREKGEELIARAEGIIEREIAGAFEDGEFNMAVRRAQEAVELTLKGALTVFGIGDRRLGMRILKRVRNL